ncbi:MAG: GNAT family N-acyltransferase [Pseudomonadota bacterium]
MLLSDLPLSVRFAATPEDVIAAQRLRYEVFVEELGASGDLVDHDLRLERDRFDSVADHLLLEDRREGGQVVGVYRLITEEAADRAGGFYTEGEYDLSRLRGSGRRLLELGRSCLHPKYRGGAAMLRLWQGLGDYISDRGIEVMFGVASFHGVDPSPVAGALSHLHHRFLAPEALRVRARGDGYQAMNLLPRERIDRVAAMRATPALIKAYLKLGGMVGEGAYIDRVFNTIDVCLVMDTVTIADGPRRRYASQLV